MAKVGGVPSLLGMAATQADSELVQAQFAGVLRDLCCADELAIEIHAAGGVKVCRPRRRP